MLKSFARMQTVCTISCGKEYLKITLLLFMPHTSHTYTHTLIHSLTHSGGIELIFNGSNLDVVQNPMLIFDDPNYTSNVNVSGAMVHVFSTSFSKSHVS